MQRRALALLRRRVRARGQSADDPAPSLAGRAWPVRRQPGVGAPAHVGIDRDGLLSLQRTIGNRQVARLVAGQQFAGRLLQRWPVGLAPETVCDEAIAGVDAESPHAPEWAKTTVEFTWSGDFKITGSEEKGYTLKVNKAKVSMTKHVDMPQWAPTDKATKKAWKAGIAKLRAHERLHEKIGAAWKTKLLTRLKALRLPVDDPAQDEATSQVMVQEKWDEWIAEHQAAQEAIDPYAAEFACPAS
jgi:predicted secreted Zn-dependent protease